MIFSTPELMWFDSLVHQANEEQLTEELIWNKGQGRSISIQ